MKISRRTLMGVFSFLFAIASFPFWVEATDPVVITARGRRIHFSSFVLDGHNDLPWAIRNQAASSFDNLDISLPVRCQLVELRACTFYIDVRARFLEGAAESQG